MKFNTQILLFVLISGIIAGCAKIGTPVGGPKDNTPPKIVSSTPKNMATNFSDKKIEITFDEFIKFKDREKAFVTSPPFKKKPEVILKYKTVVVNFKEDLLPNTTYSINFGNSVTDNNEGNPIRDFEFVFSTGSYIDSLSFEGKVVNAFDHKADKEGLFVMLYDQMGDSVPYKTLPVYTAKTNERGFFRVNHLKPDTFRVVAIKDNNNNFLYDPNEDIAFSDSLLYLNNSYYHAPDSAALADTTTSDSAYYSRFKPQMIMYSFNNETKKQYLSKKERPKRNQLFFNYNAPLDTFKIQIPDYTSASAWYLKEQSANGDSVTLWITDTTLIKRDTLQTVLIYPMPDSMNILRPKYDTLTMVYRAPKEQRRGKNKDAGMEYLGLSHNAADNFDLNKSLTVEADAPIDSVNAERIYFTYTEDSVYYPVKFNIRKEKNDFRKFVLDFKPIAGAQYSLSFDSLAVTSIYKTYNDSVGRDFTAQKEDYYGAIKATLSNVNGNVILQVLNDKESIIKWYTVSADKLVTIDFLAPGKYSLKVIYDRNENGSWDPGDLIKRLQPESVEYFKDVIEVRSNWDVEVNWNLGDSPEGSGNPLDNSQNQNQNRKEER